MTRFQWFPHLFDEEVDAPTEVLPQTHLLRINQLSKVPTSCSICELFVSPPIRPISAQGSRSCPASSPRCPSAQMKSPLPRSARAGPRYRSNNGVPALWPTFRRKPEDFLVPDLFCRYVELIVFPDILILSSKWFVMLLKILNTVYPMEISLTTDTQRRASLPRQGRPHPFHSHRSLSEIFPC